MYWNLKSDYVLNVTLNGYPGDHMSPDPTKCHCRLCTCMPQIHKTTP